MLEYTSTKSNDDTSFSSAKIKSGMRIEELQACLSATPYLTAVALYMDVHIPKSITVGLRFRGVDVVDQRCS
jgi:hypothetical protein